MMPNQPLRPPVILVVEDEALLRMLAHDHFEDAGFEVLEAANGPEALEILAERPDIRAVLTDVQMPGNLDGLELARTFRASAPAARSSSRRAASGHKRMSSLPTRSS